MGRGVSIAWSLGGELDIIFVGVCVSLLLFRNLADQNLVVFENGWEMNFGNLVSGNIWGGTIESAIDIEIILIGEDPKSISPLEKILSYF